MLTSFSVLAMRPVPLLASEEELDLWGNQHLEVLLTHFGQKQQHTYKGNTYTSEPLVDTEQTKEEWVKLKKVVKSQQYPCNSTASLWRLIVQFHGADFPNLTTLAALALAHPIHTADCERAFSSQNHVVSPLRNRISPEHCDQLMRVLIEGGTLERFEWNACVVKWRQPKERVLFK